MTNRLSYVFATEPDDLSAFSGERKMRISSRHITTTIIAVTASLLLQAAQAADVAFAWANNSTAASYAPNASYTFNDGQSVRVTRRSRGIYQVAFGRVASGGATVHAEIYGSDPGHCNVWGWTSGIAHIRCFDHTGAPADRRYTVFAVKGTSADTTTLGYAWLSNPTASTYAADAGYSFGSGNRIVNRSSAGVYRIKLTSDGHTFTTAGGYQTPARCRVTTTPRGSVSLACGQLNRALIDARATVLSINRGFERFSYAANVSTSGELFDGSFASDGSTQSVTRLSTGRYRVKIGPEANVGGIVMVTPLLTYATCRVESWAGGFATVLCLNGDTPEDAGFGVAALARGTTTPLIVVIPPIIPLSSLADETELFAPGRSGPISTVAYRLAGKGTEVPIRYQTIDGWAIAEGDIILGRHTTMRMVEEARRNCSGDICSIQSPLVRIEGENYLWPGGVIPYEIDSAFSVATRQAILAGIAMVDTSTNLIVKPRSGESDYIRFVLTSGCASWVGRQGGQQVINVGQSSGVSVCAVGSIAHETLHSAGIWHEQSREDRNSFVRILTANIQDDKRDNFDQHISDGVDVAAYDYGSIMHYGARAFGKIDSAGNRLTTIEVLTPGENIGQRLVLSPADISGVNSLYAAEDCIFFNPDRLSISEVSAGKWRLDERLPDGRTHNIVIVGDNRAEGERSLALVRAHRFDQICFVGRPDASMSYFLSGGNAPSGAQSGEDCTSINPAASRIVNDRAWKIIEDTAAGRRSVATFPNAGEAYKSLDIWRERGFRYQCFVGRPQAALTYYRR